jgi:hypothetical protein
MSVIDPFSVRFSQRSVRRTFRDGSTIDELAEGLRSGGVSPESISPIRLVNRGGTYFTLDNRRLEAFRRARVDVPYRLATEEEIESERWKFTTTNGGTSIRVR